jgi:colanic acid/amylovoran biosynthesis glycosyltransferase
MSASGMPVVSTKHCDIPQVIQDGVSGLLAEERDIDGLVRHLETLIEQPELWKKMGKAGREYIESKFDVKKQAEELAILYRGLV